MLTVPAVPEAEEYHAPSELIESIRKKAEHEIDKILESIARTLRDEGIRVRVLVTGTLPARTIVNVAEQEDVDMIMSTSHGRGSWELLMLGSEVQRVVEQSEKNVFMVPIRDRPM